MTFSQTPDISVTKHQIGTSYVAGDLIPVFINVIRRPILLSCCLTSAIVRLPLS